MSKIIPFAKTISKNKLWATAFYLKGKRYVTNIYSSHQQAIEDCIWRQKEVQAYKQLLISAQQPIPEYYVTTVHQSELPKNWKPLPALGFLLKTKLS
ncbi:hypothetical protein [Commensalibacter papalotli (ex Servin-Garciduenas et al. 2014)]|uniref:Uncharacterized protein n=1 Tax=Commensalibacter papalotli (ex Servin-Garciduenas et al. 2014) TaxID=1208583 RepID=W7DYJ6_9PROT|nr:hypothetical protein [Commensalibacter papalotli (ex Servin-Garciduenas et al. 2014)]EUK17749.1 hypothetical protein COMX_07140 [Commensalibacter papalotli (ex Servin-Garciduenas et al. 2014)]